MPPQAVALALFALQEAIRLAPELQAQITDLLTKPDPTQADWDALRARVLAKDYRAYVPKTSLPPEE